MGKPWYFARRAPDETADFEESYWGVVVDPDGQRRDPSTERRKKLEDLEHELAFVNALTPGRILDVGCGMGHLLSGVREGWQRYGVELSQFAAEKARAWGEITVGDLRSAAFPNEFFDVVTLYHVLEHMLDPVAELREIRRVLRRGGHLVVGTPNFDSACARRFGERYRMLHDRTHISLFSDTSLRRLLEDLGFEIHDVDYPFFETRYFTSENLERLFDTARISPAFYGNLMTFYCTKPACSASRDAATIAGRAYCRLLAEQVDAFEAALQLLQRAHSSQVILAGVGRDEALSALRAGGFDVSGQEETDRTSDGVVIALGAAAAGRCKRRGPTLAVIGDGEPATEGQVILRVPLEEPAIVALVFQFLVAAASSMRDDPAHRAA